MALYNSIHSGSTVDQVVTDVTNLTFPSSSKHGSLLTSTHQFTGSIYLTGSMFNNGNQISLPQKFTGTGAVGTGSWENINGIWYVVGDGIITQMDCSVTMMYNSQFKHIKQTWVGYYSSSIGFVISTSASNADIIGSDPANGFDFQITNSTLTGSYFQPQVKIKQNGTYAGTITVTTSENC